MPYSYYLLPLRWLPHTVQLLCINRVIKFGEIGHSKKLLNKNTMQATTVVSQIIQLTVQLQQLLCTIPLA